MPLLHIFHSIFYILVRCAGGKPHSDQFTTTRHSHIIGLMRQYSGGVVFNNRYGVWINDIQARLFLRRIYCFLGVKAHCRDAHFVCLFACLLCMFTLFTMGSKTATTTSTRVVYRADMKNWTYSARCSDNCVRHRRKKKHFKMRVVVICFTFGGTYLRFCFSRAFLPFSVSV